MYKPRIVNVRWLKQRSGNYALKGIMITEGERAYDSSTAFREEDAAWLTSMLGAKPDVEVSGSNSSGSLRDDTPEWARAVAASQEGERIPSIELERAKTTVLRYFLESLLVACSPDNAATLDLQAVAASAALVLHETGTGEQYTLAEARAILGSRMPKATAVKAKK